MPRTKYWELVSTFSTRHDVSFNPFYGVFNHFFGVSNKHQKKPKEKCFVLFGVFNYFYGVIPLFPWLTILCAFFKVNNFWSKHSFKDLVLLKERSHRVLKKSFIRINSWPSWKNGISRWPLGFFPSGIIFIYQKMRNYQICRLL